MAAVSPDCLMLHEERTAAFGETTAQDEHIDEWPVAETESVDTEAESTLKIDNILINIRHVTQSV
jgi:hypothetical protein